MPRTKCEVCGKEGRRLCPTCKNPKLGRSDKPSRRGRREL